MQTNLDKPEAHTLRIAVIDDFPVTRRGIISLVIDAGFGEAAIWELDSSTAAKQIYGHNWDLVLLGVPIAEGAWLALIKEIVSGHPLTHLLVLSELQDQKYEIAALRAGATGYLHKGSQPGEIITAIKKIVEGDNFVSRNLVHALVEQLNHHPRKRPEEMLSEREYQVLRGLVEGKTPKELASDMHLSAKTISTYRTRICAKLNVQSNAGLVRYALKHKLAS